MRFIVQGKGISWTTRKGRVSLLLFMILSLFPAVTLAQGQAEGITLTAEAGFDSRCKNEHWIPVRIKVENQGPGFEGRLEVHIPSLTSDETIYSQQISLPNSSRKEINLTVFPEGYASEILIILTANQGEIVRQTMPLSCSGTNDSLVGVLSSDPSTFNILANLDPPNGRTIVAQLDPADLPDQAPALGALDILVISGVDTGQFSPAQTDALSGWVAGGGRLIITGGSSWQKTSAGLGDLLPLLPEDTQTLSSLDALSSYSGSTDQLGGSSIIAVGPLAESSQVVVEQSGIPLVVRRQTGFGEVIYLAADPSLEPLKGWSSGEAFYRRLLSRPLSAPSWASGFQDWGSAASAVSTLPSLGMPPAGLILGFLSIYVAVIGPANYLLLRKLKRRELAWLSIPLVVIIFSALAFFIGNQVRGNRPVLNRLAIVQVWPGVKQARVNALVGIFSPGRETYQINIAPGFLPHAIPGNFMLARRGGWTFIDEDQAGTRVPDVRLDVAGINSLALEGQSQSPSIAEDLSINFNNNGVILEGRIENESNLLLKNAVLLVPGRAEYLGEFRPGETRDLQVLLHTSGRAIPAATDQAQLLRGGMVYSGGPAPNNDPLVSDILGTQDFYSDKETYQRYSLLTAALGYRITAASRGSGTYLAGWSDASPVEVTPGSQNFISKDTTLYIIALNPQVVIEKGPLKISPGLFTWSVLDPGSVGNPSPYDTYLDQGSFSLRFDPVQPLNFQAVDSLTLHLNSYGAGGPTDFDLSLWNFETGDWQILPVSSWGDHDIAEPQRFVSEEGEIRLRLDNGSDFSPASIEQADFTLVVK